MMNAKSPPQLWEEFEELHLRALFRHLRVDCVFDIGANVGQYYTLIRDRVGFRGPIISYEPIPELASRLRTGTQADRDWHVEEKALDRESGETDFNIMASHPFSSLKKPRDVETSRFRNMNRVSRVVKIQTSTLALEFQKYSALVGFTRPFLKMDTQGNDLAVVEGAGSFIERFVGLQSELSIRRIYENTLYYHEVIDHYIKKGFVLSALVPNAGHFPDLIEIDCIMYRGNTRLTERVPWLAMPWC
jgi:FkbM family methyltransferase